MSNNADFDALENELRTLGVVDGTACPHREALLVARLMPDFDLGRWQEFLRRYPAGHWYARPVNPTLLPKQAPVITGGRTAGLAHLLLAEMFIMQIRCELQRLSRTGGDLAIIEVGLCARETVAVQLGVEPLDMLDAQLVAALQQRREDCDSLGCTGQGRYALLLPGVSILRARLMAEQIQKTFATLAAGALASYQCKSAATPICALGIACLGQGCQASAQALLQQAGLALGEALQKQEHICVAGGTALDKRATLVHSSEKRFLFFGGN